MEFISVNVYRHGDDLAFDPSSVLERLQTAFPQLHCIPGDQFAIQMDLARGCVDDSQAGRQALRILERDSRRSGPAYTFRIPISNDTVIEGVVKRFQIQFGCDPGFPENMSDKLFAFLSSELPEEAHHLIQLSSSR